MEDVKDDKPVWELFKLANTDEWKWEDERLCVGIRKKKNGWQVLAQEKQDLGLKEQVEEAWADYIINQQGQIKMLPLLPERPLVIRPENGIIIYPEENANYFVQVPLLLGIVINDKKGKEQYLREIPLEKLSQTWFGDPLNGELCYGIDDHLIDNLKFVSRNTEKALCKINISNKSPYPLNFTRFCLRVPYLEIYKYEQQLWTNNISVEFRSPEQYSRVQIHKQKNKQMILITKARTKAEANLIKKTFSLIWPVENL